MKINFEKYDSNSFSGQKNVHCDGRFDKERGKKVMCNLETKLLLPEKRNAPKSTTHSLALSTEAPKSTTNILALSTDAKTSTNDKLALSADTEDKHDFHLAPEDLIPPRRACFALCLAFIFSYSAFEAIQNLQSSLNSEHHLGLLSLAILYLGMTLGSFLGPSYARLVGHKNILLINFLVQLCYTCINFFPAWATLIPVSTVLGVTNGAGTMSRSVYIASISTSYIHYKKLPPSRLYCVMSLFYGFFYSSFKATQITGNLMSSGILLSAKYNESKLRDNACGAQICSDFDDSAEFEQPSESVLHMLFGCYLLCNTAGLLIIAFGLPKLRNIDVESKRDETVYQLIRESISDSFAKSRNPKLIILMPFAMAQSITSMVVFTGYTKAFVTCTVGVQWVGYCMVTFGVASSITALMASYLARYTGRIFQFVVGMGIDITTIIFMLLWEPDHTTSPMILMGIPIMAGVSGGILPTQLQALIGIVFPKEQLPSAYAAMNGVKCLAFSLYLCVACTGCLYHGLILALALYLPAMLGYGYTELREWRRERDKRETA